MAGATIAQVMFKIGIDATAALAGESKIVESNKKIQDSVKKSSVASNAAGKEIAKAIEGIAAKFAIAGLAAKTFSLALNFGRNSEEIRRQSAEIGTSTIQLRTWQRALQSAGVDTEETTATLQALGNSVRDASRGVGDSVFVFTRLGVATRNADGSARDATDTMGELVEKLTGLDDRSMRAWAEKAKIPVGVLLSIKATGKGIDELLKSQREAAIRADQNAKAAQAFARGMDQMRMAGDDLGGAFFAVVGPALVWLVDKISWLTTEMALHKPLIVGILAGIAIAGAIAIAPLAASIIAATWPFIAIGAAVAAVAVIFDDLWTMFTGGDSVIGRFLDKFGLLTPLLKFVSFQFNALKIILGSAWEILQKVIDGIGGAIGFVGKIFGFKQGGNEESKNETSENPAIQKKINDERIVQSERVRERINIPDAARGAAAAARNPLVGGAQYNISSPTSANRSATVGQVVINTTSGDAQGIAKEIGRSLGDELNSSNSGTWSGQKF